MRTTRWMVSILVGLGGFAERVGAADPAGGYPSRPIRIVVGSTPGGTPDVLARLVGHKLGEAWNQPVVIKNRVPSVVGYNAVAKSTPDTTGKWGRTGS